MRGLATVLMGLGVLLGAGVSAAMLLHLGIPGLHWMVLIGLAKLTLVGSLGLIAAGAVVRRLAIRAEQRQALLMGSGHEAPMTPPEIED